MRWVLIGGGVLVAGVAALSLWVWWRTPPSFNGMRELAKRSLADRMRAYEGWLDEDEVGRFEQWVAQGERGELAYEEWERQRLRAQRDPRMRAYEEWRREAG